MRGCYSTGCYIESGDGDKGLLGTQIRYRASTKAQNGKNYKEVYSFVRFLVECFALKSRFEIEVQRNERILCYLPGEGTTHPAQHF